MIPVLICIDVEPDAFFIAHDRQLPWRGYECAVAFFHDRRSRQGWLGRSGARLTWVFRMDPQVEEVYRDAGWVIDHYPAEIAELERHGDECGVHPHAYRWDPAARHWISDHGNQPWIEHCLDLSFATFQRVFGRPCQTLRFGDRWMNDPTIDSLQRRGLKYDLTLEPGQPALSSYHPRRPFTGSLPDYTDTPTRPYHPVVNRYREADRSRADGLWIVPMTSARVMPRWHRRLYYRATRPSWRRETWTALLSHDPVLFRRIVEDALGRPEPRFLALPVRSDVFAQPRLRNRVAANLDWLDRHPLAGRFTGVAAAELVRVAGDGSPMSA